MATATEASEPSIKEKRHKRYLKWRNSQIQLHGKEFFLAMQRKRHKKWLNAPGNKEKMKAYHQQYYQNNKFKDHETTKNQ